MNEITPFAGTEEDRRDRASKPILDALRRADKEFNDWQATCHDIDSIYNLDGGGLTGDGESYHWTDAKLDLFWSSFEILKPAVYARPPRPAVAPMFRDSRKLHNTTAELLERVAYSSFARTNIDDVMTQVRDDLIFAGRGVMWLRYESDDGQKVCIEHLDRTDFLHEPARKWGEVGWVAARFWMTQEELEKRFTLTQGQKEQVSYTGKRDRSGEDHAVTEKAGVWEVWHRADNKVYWVTDGVDVLLDSDEPHLKLSGFFPCPRPAYATLKRRSLVPVPDWQRYAIHFRKISDLTGRIYLLLDKVRMKGLIPAGGDVGDAIELLLNDDSDQIIVPVPGAAMADGAANFVAWMPLAELATAIQGLIQARAQLIDDFYQLSGISDIMRGATEAEETLGAQQLKSQYGSVRVRCRIDELQRIAADAVKIATEIIAENFTGDTLTDMAQMELPTRKEVKDRIKEVEEAAEAELKALGDQMQQAQGVDPQQAQAQFQEAQQAIFAKYGPMLAEAEGQVPIEDIVDLLRDDRARSFTFEIESDSTILTDEMQEKESRNEFIGAFMQASQGLMGIAAMGEPGAKLAGEMMKFALAPFRAGRQLDGAIDAFIDAAPEMAAQAQGDDGGLAEAQNKLAEAEMQKAQAQMLKVEADSQAKMAESQRKMAEMQQKAASDQMKAEAEMEKLRQSGMERDGKLAEAQAKIDNLTAQTAQILHNIGLDVRKQELAEYQVAEQSQQRQVDNAMAVEGAQVERQFRERGEERSDRQQQLSEQENGNG